MIKEGTKRPSKADGHLCPQNVHLGIQINFIELDPILLN